MDAWGGGSGCVEKKYILKNIYYSFSHYLYLKIISHNLADNLWVTVYISNGSLILITYNRLVVFNLFAYSINNSRSLVFSLGAAVFNSWDRGVYGTWQGSRLSLQNINYFTLRISSVVKWEGFFRCSAASSMLFRCHIFNLDGACVVHVDQCVIERLNKTKEWQTANDTA